VNRGCRNIEADTLKITEKERRVVDVYCPKCGRWVCGALPGAGLNGTHGLYTLVYTKHPNSALPGAGLNGTHGCQNLCCKC